MPSVGPEEPRDLGGDAELTYFMKSIKGLVVWGFFTKGNTHTTYQIHRINQKYHFQHIKYLEAMPKQQDNKQQ